jgi:hypothetical protein
MTETVIEREKYRLARYALARVKSEARLVRIETVFHKEVAPDAAVYQDACRKATKQLSQDEENAKNAEERVVALATFYRVREAARIQFVRNTDAAHRRYDQAINQCAADLANVQREIDQDFV